MQEVGYLENHPITLIDIDGELININREYYTDHTPAFEKLESMIKGLFYGYEKNLKNSSGYEMATFVAASGYVVIWPLDINKTNPLMISIPEIPTTEQIERLENMYPLFENKEVYATNSKFKKRSSHVPRTIPISESGQYEDVVNSLGEYFDVVKQIENYGSEVEGDFRDTIRHK